MRAKLGILDYPDALLGSELDEVLEDSWSDGPSQQNIPWPEMIPSLGHAPYIPGGISFREARRRKEDERWERWKQMDDAGQSYEADIERKRYGIPVKLPDGEFASMAEVIKSKHEKAAEALFARRRAHEAEIGNMFDFTTNCPMCADVEFLSSLDNETSIRYITAAMSQGHWCPLDPSEIGQRQKDAIKRKTDAEEREQMLEEFDRCWR